jgi:hypothetical protein
MPKRVGLIDIEYIDWKSHFGAEGQFVQMGGGSSLHGKENHLDPIK